MSSPTLSAEPATAPARSLIRPAADRRGQSRTVLGGH